MAFWVARIPFSGTASIAIDSDKKPNIDEFRAFLHRGEFDKGMPQYFTMKADVEKIDERMYRNIKRLMKRRSSIENLSNEILKKAENV